MEQRTLHIEGDKAEVQRNLQVLVLRASLLLHPGKLPVVSLVWVEWERTTTVQAVVVVGTVVVVLNTTLVVAVALVMLVELPQQR
jgi:hypothetical protein